MKKRTKIILEVILGVILVCSVIIFIKTQFGTAREVVEETTEFENEVPAELCYSYSDVEALVYKMANSDEEKQALSKLSDPLTKSYPITVAYINNIFDTLGIPKGKNIKAISTLTPETFVTKEQFDEIYDNLAFYELVPGLKKSSVYVFSVTTTEQEDGTKSISASDSINSYNVTCDEDIKEYIDGMIEVYVKDDEIFKILGLSDKAFVIENAWITENSDEQISFVYKNATKSYPRAELAVSDDDNEYSEFENNTKSKILADVVICNQGIAGIKENKKLQEVKVLKTTSRSLVVENKGSIVYDDDFKIYDVSHAPFCEESVAVLAGHKTIGLVIDHGKAIAAVIKDDLVSDNIRVILNNDDFTSYEMDRVIVSSDDEFEIEYPDETTEKYEARREIILDLDEFKNKDKIKVKTVKNDGKIKVLSINREYGNPEYRGTIEIDVYKEYMHVINELPLEQYLYSTISSEMPVSNPMEALKAQAICSRGYAYTKLEDKSYSDYNAHIDDSHNCQMYNNVEETPETIKAVKDTYGMICTYDDKAIVPLYFSTSCGVTCTNEEIWGGTAYNYLKTNIENLDKSFIELDDEDAFKAFIDSPEQYDMIEKDLPYFRWSVDFTTKDITNAINSTLEERMSSGNIMVENSNGKFVKKDIDSIGAVKSIEITERSKSGVVTKMVIEGTEYKIEVTGQTNIRNIITPVNQNIIRADESIVTGWTSLPSPFYYIEQTKDGYVIRGGGFGHGVGMSQTGAKELADKGYNFSFIIGHYYYPTSFKMAYDISGDEENTDD